MLLEALSRLDRGPEQHLTLHPETGDPGERLAALTASEPRALVVVADPEDGAGVLRAIGETGFSGQVFGSPQLARRACLALAQEAAEGVRVPILETPADRQAERRDFASEFHRRTECHD